MTSFPTLNLILAAFICSINADPNYDDSDPENWYGDDNCYEIFRIPEDASYYEVKREYGFVKRRGVKPKEAFTKLKGCYHILSSPGKRSLYHKSGFDYDYAMSPPMLQNLKYTVLNQFRSVLGPVRHPILAKIGLKLPNPMPNDPPEKEEM